MTKLTSLILPSTIADQATIRQLLLFSDTVFQFAPSEASIDASAISAFNNLYHHHAPAPLDDNLQTFQRFIKDLTTNRAEYYSGALSHLSTGFAADIDESSVWQLINKLAETTAQEGQQSKDLMHARLLLTLAEVHHKEEAEINSALADIDSQVNQVFAELKSEEDQLLTNIVGNGQTQRKSTPLQIIKAWFHLLSADQSSNHYSIIATDEETFSTLNEYASTLLAPQQNVLCSFSIPPEWFAGSPEDFINCHSQHTEAKHSAIKQFQEFLLQAAENKVTLGNNSDEINKMVEAAFGKNLSGSTATFYILPISLPQLAGKIINKTTMHEAQGYLPHTIVVVITT